MLQPIMLRGEHRLNVEEKKPRNELMPRPSSGTRPMNRGGGNTGPPMRGGPRGRGSRGGMNDRGRGGGGGGYNRM